MARAVSATIRRTAIARAKGRITRVENKGNVLSCLYAVRGVEDVPSGGGLPIDRATVLVPETTAERFNQATVTVI